MAASPLRYISFLTVTILTVLSLIYYMTFNWIVTTSLVEFYVLVGVLPYSVYMFFYEFKTEKRQDLSQGLVNEERKCFMIDTYCKFLFPFIFAMFFTSLVNTFMQNMANIQNQTFLYFFICFYICIALPVLCVVDMYKTARTRNPAPGKDIIILLILCLGQCCYRILATIIYYGSLAGFLPIVAQYMVLGLVVVNGYILYDYINHRRNGGTYYIMFGKVEDLNPDHRENRRENTDI